MKTIVLAVPGIADPASHIAAALGIDPNDLTVVETEERVRVIFEPLEPQAEEVRSAFWYSLNHRASRQYLVADICYAASAFGACRVFYDSTHQSVREAADVAARILGGQVRQLAPNDLEVRTSVDVPPLAGVPRIGTDGLLNRAATALGTALSLSFIRINHCEPRVIALGDLFTLRDTQWTTEMQWGRADVGLAEMTQLASRLREAVARADIVGIPRFQHVARGMTGTLERSVYYLGAERGFFRQDVALVDAITHNRLSLHPGMFKLIRSAQQVILISARECVELDRAVGRNDLVRLRVPPEHNGNGGHYPVRYQEVLTEIESRVRPGTLVLVGAGILGKLYCDAVKTAGGVALDMGAVFDAWEGLNTRSGFRLEMTLEHQFPKVETSRLDTQR